MKRFTLVLPLVLLTGCHFKEMLKEAEKRGADGVTPIGAIVRDIPRAAAGDPMAIWGVASGVGSLLITAIFGHQHGKRKQKKKQAIAQAFAAKVLPQGT